MTDVEVIKYFFDHGLNDDATTYLKNNEYENFFRLYVRFLNQISADEFSTLSADRNAVSAFTDLFGLDNMLSEMTNIPAFLFYIEKLPRFVILPRNIKVIEKYALSEVYDLEALYIPETVETIGSGAVDNRGVTVYIDPKSKFARPDDFKSLVTDNSRSHFRIATLDDFKKINNIH